MKYLFNCDKRTSKRARKSYADRTGMSARASVILAAAVIVKPETFEDDNGNTIRVWKSSEMSSYSNADIASCLINRVAVEPNEMLGTVPPSAIKYAVTKGWLVPNGDKTLYRVTLKGAIELDLPLRFKGKFNGRRIPFVVTRPAASTAK
jgi:hypothetical protein